MKYWRFQVLAVLQALLVWVNLEVVGDGLQSAWETHYLLWISPVLFVAGRLFLRGALKDPALERFRGVWRGVNVQLFAVVVGTSICTFGYYVAWLLVLVLSGPIFLYGFICIIVSRAPVWVRLVVAFWPVAIPVYFIGQYQWEDRTMVRETYLLPDGYLGKVRVAFGVPGGGPPSYEGKRRVVLRVDKDGLCRTTYHFRQPYDPALVTKAAQARRFYYEDAHGARRRLESIDVPTVKETVPGVEVGYVGLDLEGRNVLGVEFEVHAEETK